MGEAMIFRAILVVGFILGMAGCADNEQAASESAEEASMGAADATAIDPVWRNESFVTHMHEHAEKLDDLNFALADGDLDTAKTARHPVRLAAVSVQHAYGGRSRRSRA
jgi:hypothetical protein